MIRRLRFKFVVITMTLVTVMMAVIFGLVLKLTRDNLESQSLRAMQSVGENPVHMRPFDLPDEQPRLPCFVLQVGRNGSVIASGSDYFDLSDEEFLREILNLTLNSPEQSGVLKPYALRYLRIPGPKGNSVVFSDISGELAALRDLVKSCAGLFALSFAAFLLLSVLLARWAVKPVEQAWNRQRQFVADASHELKTPLTVIMTNAELLREECGTGPGARFTGSILAMSRQMRGLVEGLLELARLDNGAARQTHRELDLSGLISEGTLPFEPVFFEKGMKLECAIEPLLRVRGSEAQLRQVLDILLDNAAKYASSGATVRLSLRLHRGQCLLAVENPGEPISREDLSNIFKRFYRADKARTMNHSYGLGLSIAQSIVLEHRGRIWAESTGGVNTFFVQLPAARGRQ